MRIYRIYDVMFTILYGVFGRFVVDVTEVCLKKLRHENAITIPSGDHARASHFGDPLCNVQKKIYIMTDETKVLAYDESILIHVNVETGVILTYKIEVSNEFLEQELEKRTRYLQSKLKLNGGSFNEEYPEQKMAVKHLTGKEKVLEIGGNIGRNSLIIGSLLENQENLVVMECDNVSANILRENREINGFKFHIEPSALSKRRLIQHKTHWVSMPSDELIDGYNWVDTITVSELKNKYNIDFDTLILDCEGAFYYILMDMPEILDGVNLIMMENDYTDISKKYEIDEHLTKNNFRRIYFEPGGWGPCYSFFFETWRRFDFTTS